MSLTEMLQEGRAADAKAKAVSLEEQVAAFQAGLDKLAAVAERTDADPRRVLDTYRRAAALFAVRVADLPTPHIQRHAPMFEMLARVASHVDTGTEYVPRGIVRTPYSDLLDQKAAAGAREFNGHAATVVAEIRHEIARGPVERAEGAPRADTMVFSTRRRGGDAGYARMAQRHFANYTDELTNRDPECEANPDGVDLKMLARATARYDIPRQMTTALDVGSAVLGSGHRPPMDAWVAADMLRGLAQKQPVDGALQPHARAIERAAQALERYAANAEMADPPLAMFRAPAYEPAFKADCQRQFVSALAEGVAEWRERGCGKDEAVAVGLREAAAYDGKIIPGRGEFEDSRWQERLAIHAEHVETYGDMGTPRPLPPITDEPGDENWTVWPGRAAGRAELAVAAQDVAASRDRALGALVEALGDRARDLKIDFAPAPERSRGINL